MRWLPEPGLLPLNFDYQAKPQGRLQSAAWLLLIIAVAFSTDVGRHYFETRAALRTDMAQLAAFHQKSPSDKALSDYVPHAPEREVAYARATIYRMALPWDDIFSGLGGSPSQDIALLDVTPDAAGGNVQVTAEAKNLATMLDYVARLEHSGRFRNVDLLHHEIRDTEPRYPVSFAVLASWKGAT